MNIRPRTLRRLLILFAAASVLMGILICLIVAGIVRNARVTKRIRVEAMSAYGAGDYARSVDLLQTYRAMTGVPDAEAEFAYGVSRIHVELPEGKHLVEGAHVFEQYLRNVKPGDAAAERELLQLYVVRGYFPEAIQLADELLAANPRDGVALNEKVLALVGRHQPGAALAISRKLNDIQPLNLREQIVTIMLLVQLNTPPAQVIAHAEKLHADHPADPRFEALLAFACSQEQQDESAMKWLKQAAVRKPPDAQFVVDLTKQLDEGGLFAESDAFVIRSAAAIADVSVQRMLAERLWEDGKVPELEDRLKNQTAESPRSDGILMAYRALALNADMKRAEANALVGALAARADAPSAAWAIGLQAQFASPPLAASELASRLAAATARDPENPILHMMLADAYLRMSESELTIQQCVLASRRARSWAAPFLMMAEAQTTTGRQVDAVESARQALDRAPSRYETRLMRARTFFAWAMQSGLSSDYTNLLAYLEEMQRTYHDAQTLPFYITVLARTAHRDRAAKEVQAAIDADPALPTETLGRIAEACDEEKLGLGQKMRELAQKIQGVSPEISFSQARAMLRAGRGAQGLEFLVKAGAGHEKEPGWRIAVAQYREAFGQGDALRDWIALGDEYPADLPLQQTILRAQSRLGDRAFWERTIERVKAITGDQGLLWRTERSRWLLAGPLTERDKAEAVNLLTQVTAASPGLAEPHRLLALAMEKVQNVPGAIAELTEAADDHPGDPTITRELVRLLLANSRAADAMAYLDKLATSRELTVDARHWLARAYAGQGCDEKAIAVLIGQSSMAADDERDRLLAQLYRRVGRNEQAGQLYWSLLEEPIVDPVFWAGGADFFASQGDMARAERFLQRLMELPLHPGEIETIRAEFAERWLGKDEALRQYEAATRAGPDIAGTWAALTGFQIRRQRYAQALAAVELGLKSNPNDEILNALSKDVTALQNLEGGQDLQSLREAICAEPRESGATRMLAEFAAAKAARLGPADTARRTALISDRYPQNLALQTQAVRSFIQAGLTESAADVAHRAALNNPGSGEPQRLLAEIYAGAGDWTHAEQAALLWRRRAPVQAMYANIALAKIYLSRPRKDPAAAIDALKTYPGSKAFGDNPQLLEPYTRALVLTNRGSEAAALLFPRLGDSAKCRALWLDLAVSQTDAATGSAWIERAVPFVPKDIATEQCELAKAWYAVGSRFESPAALDSAATVLAPLTSSAVDVPQAWVLTALTAQARGDYDTAEKAYRRVLSRNSHSPDCLNDLAYLMWLRGRDADLPAARAMSESAIALRPNEASFYDTLARIQAKSGNVKLANQTFQIALQKNPDSLEAMIGQADLLSHDPASREEAKSLIIQIQSLMGDSPVLSSELLKQYQRARETLASSL